MTEPTNPVPADYDQAIVAPLLANPILGQCTYESLARALPHVTEQWFRTGETLYEAGSIAEQLIVLREGSIRLERPHSDPILSRQYLCGEETAVGLDEYLGSAIAATPVSALVIPRASALALVKSNPSLRSEFFRGLALPGTAASVPTAQKTKPGKKGTG